MINSIALVVAAKQAPAHKIRYRPANIAAAGAAHTIADLAVDYILSLGTIGRQLFCLFKFGSDRFDRQSPARITLSHWNKRVAEPVPHRNGAVTSHNVGAGATLFVCDLREKLEQHEGKFRA
ncbi:hypothetical protein [Sphingobium sp. B12D2B]|uniref:hypothetical protein n=1 Tax=Sphingobium sp. B12D2B TaxID=2940577 RepID=UPI0029CAB53A|nr:hypothetical protein [Sphingobium sp. B12D2B]MCW2351760.1 hypothetical protein [Sphingobium sp. B12D2B]